MPWVGTNQKLHSLCPGLTARLAEAQQRLRPGGKSLDRDRRLGLGTEPTAPARWAGHQHEYVPQMDLPEPRTLHDRDAMSAVERCIVHTANCLRGQIMVLRFSLIAWRGQWSIL